MKKTAKAGPTRASTERKVGPRADHGAPIDGFFARHAPPLRQMLEVLPELVERRASPPVRARVVADRRRDRAQEGLT